ncbi:MAG: AzlC family ABC transporter permease [Pseudomonadota bacterium]
MLLSGLRHGALAILPLALGAAAYGFAFGVLAGQAGFDALQVAIMGGIVFAGSSQIVAVEQYAAGAGLLGAVLAGAALNLRYVGIVAASAPLVQDWPWHLRLFALHMATDENFALTLATRRRDPAVGGAFLLGSGLMLMAAWIAATGAGAVLGAALPDLERWGLGFAFTAAFIAMAVGLWRGRADAPPWGVAFAVAIALKLMGLASAWAIVGGAMAGLAISGLRR